MGTGPVLEASEPEASELEASEPDASEPEASKRDVAASGAVEPSIAEESELADRASETEVSETEVSETEVSETEASCAVASTTGEASDCASGGPLGTTGELKQERRGAKAKNGTLGRNFIGVLDRKGWLGANRELSHTWDVHAAGQCARARKTPTSDDGDDAGRQRAAAFRWAFVSSRSEHQGMQQTVVAPVGVTPPSGDVVPALHSPAVVSVNEPCTEPAALPVRVKEGGHEVPPSLMDGHGALPSHSDPE